MSTPADSFGSHSPDENETHDYQFRFISPDGLSGACVPGVNRSSFVFEPAYRTDVYRDDAGGQDLYELEAAVPSGALVSVFFKCLEHLDDVVDVVIESTHDSSITDWNSAEPHPCELFLREYLEKPALLEMLASYERWLFFDGMSAIAVYGSEAAGFGSPAEIKLGDDKVLYIISDDLSDFQAIMEEYGIRLNPNVTFVSDGAHIHYSADILDDMTQAFISEIGAVRARREGD